VTLVRPDAVVLDRESLLVALLDDVVEFFRSANGVWLVDEVPANFLRR
jgi:RNA:NAD 2'-phosphotransferase (TPT1/KptA family)